MEFKENDLVMTRVPMRGTNGAVVAGGSIGVVSVVGIDLPDGSISGIEVLFEGDPGSGTYGHYNDTQLTLVSKRPEVNDYVIVSNDENAHYGKTGWVVFFDDAGMARGPLVVNFKDDNLLENFHENELKVLGSAKEQDRQKLLIQEPASYILTKENFHEVARWCGGEVDTNPSSPRIYLSTGFSANPHYKATATIGDRIEKRPDGKWQIWVGGEHDYDETPSIDQEEPTIKPEDRPAEMKKFRTSNPLAAAVGLVNALYYDSKLASDDVYIVWFCATLKNWKALVSTNVKDNSYYEITHNGEQQETYVDRYVKVKNQHYKIPDEYLED